MLKIDRNILYYTLLLVITGVIFILFCFRNIYTADDAIETYTEFYNKRKTNIDTIFQILDTLKKNECFYYIQMSTKNDHFFFDKINTDSCKLLNIGVKKAIDQDKLRAQLKRIGLNDLSIRRNRNTIFLDGRNPNLKDYRIHIWDDTITVANEYYHYKQITSGKEIDDYRTAWVYKLAPNIYLVSEGI